MQNVQDKQKVIDGTAGKKNVFTQLSYSRCISAELGFLVSLLSIYGQHP